MQRYLRQLVLLKVTLLTLTAAALIGPMSGVWERMSIASAWLCFLLLTSAMLVGPWHLWRGSRPAANNLLRRDLGIWAGVSAIAHTVLGTEVSMNSTYMDQYLVTDLANDQFLYGGLAGFVAGLLMLVPLALSNNRALNRLGVRRWKRLQRFAYPVFLLTVMHAVWFQQLEGRALFLAGTAVATASVVAAQIAGIGLYRRSGK